MLEQAIVDAKTLREAAIKNAESAVIEKYSDEVRDAVGQLLEQDDLDIGLGLTDEEGSDVATDTELSPETEETVDQVPPSHLSEEETVVIDLNNIGATLEAELESGEASEDDGVDRDDMMASLEVEEDSDEEAPGNREDEEIEINEADLVELFKEVLAVDVPQGDIDMATEEEPEEQLVQDELQESPPTDGMDKKDVEELHAKLEKENENLKEQVAKLTETLGLAKETFEKINLHNARLLYANRVLSDSSLNEQQKNKIAEMVDKARTVEEAKLVYETLQKTMASTQKAAPQSLSEAVTKSSSVILGGNRRDERTTEKNNPTKMRWATLAGLNKN
jgi:hypothetical protein